MNQHLILLSLAASAVLADTFTLGQVNVLDTPLEENPFEQTITAGSMTRHSCETISDALDDMSGVNRDMQGGRGESTLHIRGFDARRLGVFIDGIPVYVPYDGNFDYGRFLTADLSRIDVSKGYSSIVYGANTMGGVVNIISKRPTKILEGNVKAGFVLGSDGDLSRRTASINIGTRQEHIYAQLGGVYNDQNHFYLSDDYTAVASQGEGDRLRSESEDYKLSFKTGYITDDGSEVAVGYANQKGEKQQPPLTDTSFSKVKYWDWPYWDKETLFVTGQKNLGNGYLKALAYYDTFENSLYAYDDATYTTMKAKSSFKSRYDDYSYGTRFEYALEAENHFLTAAANYKKDVHRGYDISKTSDDETMIENYEDNTLSVGIEDVYTLDTHWQILGGVSYDRREGDKIFDTTAAYQDLLALTTQHALNPEAAVVYSLDAASKIRASISRKTYMPSMKERYSRRLGQAIPNPDLTSEKATHYEIGYQQTAGSYSGRLNGFFTRVDDAIENVIDVPSGLYQFRNSGSFDHRGIEVELNYASDAFEAGGNYAYTSVLNRMDDTIKRIDIPRHQAFAYGLFHPQPDLSLYGAIRFRKGAYEQKLDGSYTLNPTFTTFDLKAIYKASADITAEIGVKNLTDKLYRYDMGFPMAGREFFANIGYNF